MDREPLMRRKLEEVMRGISEVNVVGSFKNSEKALEYAEENRVEFALLDTEMSQMSGLALGRKLKEVCPGIVLVYMTGAILQLEDIRRMASISCFEISLASVSSCRSSEVMSTMTGSFSSGTEVCPGSSSSGSFSHWAYSTRVLSRMQSERLKVSSSEMMPSSSASQ